MKAFGPRPGPSFYVVSAILAGVLIAYTVAVPRQWLPVVLGVIGLVIIGWARLRAVRLEITDSVVRAKQGWYQPEKQVARGDVRAIHYFPRLISFRGRDDKPIMMVAPNWNLRQMLEVADELGVSLFDHRRWHGLREVSVGRLVNDPRAKLTPPRR
jgi:hypothetical protein